MKLGDLIEVYHHLPKYDEGVIPVGKMGIGIIVDIDWPGPLITYISEFGDIQHTEPGLDGSMKVTVRVINENM